MLSEKDLENLISESDKIEIPEVVENNINSAYKVVRKTSARKRQIRTAVRSSLITVFMVSFVALAVVFNSGTVNAKSYVLEGGQLYEESSLKSSVPKISFFNKSNKLDVQISRVLYDDSSVYVEYTLVGNFNNIKNIAGINEIERDIKVIGADSIATEFVELNKISENAVVLAERMMLNNVSKGGKALIIKQNISKIEGIEGEWTVTLKIMRQKAKDDKIKDGKIKG
jgi:hypothetical protein